MSWKLRIRSRCSPNGWPSYFYQQTARDLSWEKMVKKERGGGLSEIHSWYIKRWVGAKSSHVLRRDRRRARYSRGWKSNGPNRVEMATFRGGDWTEMETNFFLLLLQRIRLPRSFVLPIVHWWGFKRWKSEGNESMLFTRFLRWEDKSGYIWFRPRSCLPARLNIRVTRHTSSRKMSRPEFTVVPG